jgi:short-subunit dehydrogenase
MNVLNRILITGASGGLGAALARQYARPGRTLLLWGRNQAALDTVAKTCHALGARTVTLSLDVSDIEAAVSAIEATDDAGPIDLVLLAAGSGDIQAPRALVEDPAQVARLGIVNFVAPCAMAAALAARMAARGRGGIVLIGSAAAFHALPFAASYAGSKAGLARFADALRIDVAKHGVRVILVSPGFIDTAAGRQVAGPKPLLMQPAAVAARIARAAERGQAHCVLPWPFALLRMFDRLLPRILRDQLLLSLAPPRD